VNGTALPTLETARLRLRPFSVADAPDVQRLAGAREIAATTLTVPHPYEDGLAEQWIATHGPAFTEGKSLTLAVTELASGALVGAVGLALTTPFSERSAMTNRSCSSVRRTRNFCAFTSATTQV